MSKRLLIVDDSDLALSWARNALMELDCKVYTCSQALNIQSMIRQAEPDVILLDVRMPAVDGDKLCRMLREDKNTKSCKMFLHSSIDEEELREKAESVGADGFLAKTDDAHEFAMNILNILKTTEN